MQKIFANFNEMETFPICILQGTLWCGKGNISSQAVDDDGLGEKKALDAACKAHDSCPIGVPGRQTKYGLWNWGYITWYIIFALQSNHVPFILAVYFILDLNSEQKN